MAKRIGKKFSEGARSGHALLRETGAALLASHLYPLGIPGYTIPVFPSPLLARGRRREGSRRIPLLFIHGIFHNGSAFVWMRQNLALRGLTDLHELNLRTTFHTIPQMAEQVGAAVGRLQEKYGVDQVDIVAHSLGGIVSRYYVQILKGDGEVRTLVTLGSPHRGTQWSRFAPLKRHRELSPGSETFRRLAGCRPPRRTQAIAISGSYDILMRPTGTEWWPGVRNIRLNRVGHTGLLFSNRVAEIIIAHVRKPETRKAALLLPA